MGRAQAPFSMSCDASRLWVNSHQRGRDPAKVSSFPRDAPKTVARETRHARTGRGRPASLDAPSALRSLGRGLAFRESCHAKPQRRGEALEGGASPDRRGADQVPLPGMARRPPPKEKALHRATGVQFHTGREIRLSPCTSFATRRPVRSRVARSLRRGELRVPCREHGETPAPPLRERAEGRGKPEGSVTSTRRCRWAPSGPPPGRTGSTGQSRWRRGSSR